MFMVCSYLAIGSASIQDVYLFKHSSYYYYHYSNPIHLSLSLSHRRRNQCSILVTPIPPSYYYYHYSNPIHLSPTLSLSHTAAAISAVSSSRPYHHHIIIIIIVTPYTSLPLSLTLPNLFSHSLYPLVILVYDITTTLPISYPT